MGEVFIGALSGTSMDAIDIVAVDLSVKHPILLAHANYPIAKELATHAKRMQSDACRLTEYAQLDRTFGKLFADCINDFIVRQKIPSEAIAAIGLHGQTILHDTRRGSPLTLQIADPNVVAYQTGLTVVADFRRADIAAGGQGAPLAPALHAQLFAEADKMQAVVNIGGIANITVLDRAQVVVGFDIGPGNCLMDVWCRKHNDQDYDYDGRWAAAYVPDMELLEVMLKDPFFVKAPPKSTCTSYFSLDWLNGYIKKRVSPSPGDVAATLAEFTAITIADALKTYITENDEVLVCGGGVHNKHLMARLRRHTQMNIMSAADKGVDPDWVEGILFAWLAKQRIENRSGIIPSLTGAREATLSGAIYRPTQLNQ